MEHDSESRHRDDADDLQAVQETLRGDRNAFGRIVDRYTPVVYSLASRYLGSSEDAEDATQEIFTRAFEALGRFRLGNRFYPWMYTVALNHLKAMRSKAARRGLRTLLQFTDRTASDDDERSLARPDQVLEQREGERLVRQALSRLPPKYRRIIILRQMDELPVADVAEILDLPEGTVKTHLHRARRLLAAEIAGTTETAQP